MTHLLISVRSAAEACAAVAGGADVVDAKEPAAGALGAVSVDVLREIVAAVGGACPVSAALGDANDAVGVEDDARAFARAGAAFVKVGLTAAADEDRAAIVLAAAVRGARPAGVIAVAWADANPATSLTPAVLVDVAARTGAAGVLLDTMDKHGPGLCALLSPLALASWVTCAKERGLLVALAGRLTPEDLTRVEEAGADIAGVRGAACDDGRLGRVTAERVRSLQARSAASRSSIRSAVTITGVTQAGSARAK